MQHISWFIKLVFEEAYSTNPVMFVLAGTMF